MFFIDVSMEKCVLILKTISILIVKTHIYIRDLDHMLVVAYITVFLVYNNLSVNNVFDVYFNITNKIICFISNTFICINFIVFNIFEEISLKMLIAYFNLVTFLVNTGADCSFLSINSAVQMVTKL